jgi:uncharacterized membrane protein YhhN
MSALPQTDAPMAPSPKLTFFALLAVVGAIVGALGIERVGGQWYWLHWICKPLATALIFMLVWRAVRPVSMRYRRDLLIGIALCLLGDVLLMLPQDLFVYGLLSFLLGHGFFIAAFSSDVRFAVRLWPWMLCLIYGALAVWVLWASLALPLRAPILLYVGVLATMAGQAWGRAIWLHAQRDSRARSARIASIGALLFMVSDSLLAWNRFRAPLPLAPLFVLTTYYAALWLIARSVERTTVTSTYGRD